MRRIVIFAAVVLIHAGLVSAQSPRPPHVYDQIDASFEAEQLFEGRRQWAVDRQRWLNEQMFFWSRSFPGWAYYTEPWPFLPGDIYGYPLASPPIRQPIGRMEEQVGPTTWFSRPVFAEELMAPPSWFHVDEPPAPREF